MLIRAGMIRLRTAGQDDREFLAAIAADQI
jgi:hypothetical protein